ncbi:3-oxo-tetronate kinase [Enterocloster lavalensis]|mgnify:CR=1 FL=1|uniref:3-oxo-tetronate kinase n=1 Tax=Enterocloster lavalensis TaxID=460384 RepID=UPI001D07E14C|nr:3-oxo-tetronate kinase [Enterocloster lavalensis]MCB6342368.1 four-carbon acid sugar kinase family protein [Enterocloster lavalensis]
MSISIRLGCIADDFTGASDAASFLVKGGMRVLLVNGVPGNEIDTTGYAAIVVALKTRTMDTALAVKESLEAVEWLKKRGTEQLYFKYCSTFDSTPKGNIGPVADAVLERYHIPYTILCPALPVNQRTVKDGILYVNGVLLHESPMKNHPLTPMWDSDIAVLMASQSRYPCMKVSRELLNKTKSEIQKEIRQFASGKEHLYLIPDFTEEKDAVRIVEVFGKLPLLTGGSGIMEELGRYHAGENSSGNHVDPKTKGRGLILAGSCSSATLSQIRCYLNRGGKAVKIDPAKLLEKSQDVQSLWEEIESSQNETILVYSSDEADEVKKVQQAGGGQISELLEQTTAELAYLAVQAGYSRIIVAGGETSGAVTQRLGFDTYQICDSVAPGVPVMIPLSNPSLRLVLKSGNFGQEDFFWRALEMTEQRER